jgi:hypothetical protein
MAAKLLSAQSKVVQKHDRKSRKKTKEELTTENYRRQMKTLFEKIHKMVSIFGIDIFLHARRNGKQRLYTSSNDLSWPAGIKDVVVSLQSSFHVRLDANLPRLIRIQYRL